MRGALGLLLAGSAALSAQAPASPPSFRSSTDAVSVEVAVFEGSTVVRGLGVERFELWDNGVRQTLTAADFNLLPIDLRLVFDVSGSISERDLERYRDTMQQVAAALAPTDRCEILTFNARIAEAAARQHPPVKIALSREGADGTAFFDAVSLAMVTQRLTDRRQVTIVLSDAMDNVSFLDDATMLEAASRTDAVVYTILPGDPNRSRAVSVSRLQALALLTGGRLMQVHEATVGAAVISALQEFRHSYVLRYMLTGTPIKGWHKIEVRVRGGGTYRVRARPGYFGH